MLLKNLKKEISNFLKLLSSFLLSLFPSKSKVGDQIVSEARKEIGAKEELLLDKIDSVNKYLRSAQLSPGINWSTAFTYYIVSKVYERLGKVNPLKRTGKGVVLWTYAVKHRLKRFTVYDVLMKREEIRAGDIFVRISNREFIGQIRNGQELKVASTSGICTGYTFGSDLSYRSFLFETIEGSVMNPNNGKEIGVYTKVHSLEDSIVGFIRLE